MRHFLPCLTIESSVTRWCDNATFPALSHYWVLCHTLVRQCDISCFVSLLSPLSHAGATMRHFLPCLTIESSVTRWCDNATFPALSHYWVLCHTLVRQCDISCLVSLLSPLSHAGATMRHFLPCLTIESSVTRWCDNATFPALSHYWVLCHTLVRQCDISCFVSLLSPLSHAGATMRHFLPCLTIESSVTRWCDNATFPALSHYWVLCHTLVRQCDISCLVSLLSPLSHAGATMRHFLLCLTIESSVTRWCDNATFPALSHYWVLCHTLVRQCDISCLVSLLSPMSHAGATMRHFLPCLTIESSVTRWCDNATFPALSHYWVLCHTLVRQCDISCLVSLLSPLSHAGATMRHFLPCLTIESSVTRWCDNATFPALSHYWVLCHTLVRQCDISCLVSLLSPLSHAGATMRHFLPCLTIESSVTRWCDNATFPALSHYWVLCHTLVRQCDSSCLVSLSSQFLPFLTFVLSPLPHSGVTMRQ